jgi:tetraacyldisaccharide 4'-kinase
VEEHAFPDHHVFQAEEVRFAPDLPLLMTEKDAVKCRRVIDGDAWVVSVQAQPDAAFVHRLNLCLADVSPDKPR